MYWPFGHFKHFDLRSFVPPSETTIHRLVVPGGHAFGVGAGVGIGVGSTTTV